MLVSASAVAACGSTHKPAATTSTTTPAATTTTVVNGTTTTSTTPAFTDVSIYSSLPESGPDAARSSQIETGIEFALHQAKHKAGSFNVSYTRLCDSTPPPHRTTSPTNRSKAAAGHKSPPRCSAAWNQAATAKNAEKAASDPHTIAYIGDLNSGATAISLPILNQAGIVQITPGSAYPGLTDAVKSPKGLTITQAGEPNKYYPEGLRNRTLLRMVPSDLVQASADLRVLHSGGCQKFSAWNFGNDPYSKSLLAAVIATAANYKMTYVAPPPITAKTNIATYAHLLSSPTGIRCAVLVGHITKTAEALTLYLRGQISPPPTIIGTSGFCTRAWLQGITPAAYRKEVAPYLYCTTPALPVAQYAGSANFIKSFQRFYKRRPTAYNLYGYAAAVMLLRALHDSAEDDAAGSDEDVRAAVLTSMVYDSAPNELSNTPGQISAFSFDTSGNVFSDRYGVDKFKHGLPAHWMTLNLDRRGDLLSSAG